MAPVSAVNEAFVSGRDRGPACTIPRRCPSSHRRSTLMDSRRSGPRPYSPDHVPSGAWLETAGCGAHAERSNSAIAREKSSALFIISVLIAVSLYSARRPAKDGDVFDRVHPPPREAGWLRHEENFSEAHLNAADGVVAHKPCYFVCDDFSLLLRPFGLARVPPAGRFASTPPQGGGVTSSRYVWT